MTQARDADSQASAAWWTVAIGGLTLLAAVAAAVFARSAALHTKAGADEAKRAADAAHDANRPWIFVKNVIWEPEADYIRILFTNGGPSPASNFIKSITGHVLPVPFAAMPIEMPDQSMASFLPPGAIEEMTLEKPEKIREGYVYRVRIALSYQWGDRRTDRHFEDFACEPDGKVRKVTPKDSANYGGGSRGLTYGEPMPIPD